MQEKSWPSLKGNRDAGENGEWVFYQKRDKEWSRLGVIVLQVNDCVDCRNCFFGLGPITLQKRKTFSDTINLHNSDNPKR
jgi:hypothetical protein